MFNDIKIQIQLTLMDDHVRQSCNILVSVDKQYGGFPVIDLNRYILMLTNTVADPVWHFS